MASEELLLRVVRGDPDDVEVAALTVVVSALAVAATAGAAADHRPPWSNPRALVRPPVAHGWGAWRASGMPG